MVEGTWTKVKDTLAAYTKSLDSGAVVVESTKEMVRLVTSEVMPGFRVEFIGA